MMLSHPTVFVDQPQVLTDFRPIFDDNAGPMAGIIIHTLRINVRQNYEENEIFITMDGRDIKYLKDALARAEAKKNR